ncbi:hypothetical protein SAMN05421788_106323 [Filimonas lacunae]|uniref:Uncharacterized protein n=1 Tax=Filimonas lacunae TaxID=477680 RepID=A0A173MFH4_9BACT|nr:hypothetical protein [Filimonas lacunae]BAV06256.1 hypothetical protein FLA_2272 [Filimonas lacunae]SIT25501.1 hypothetical protein SAMN05421788_106323 [Filimonas lacunae]
MANSVDYKFYSNISNTVIAERFNQFVKDMGYQIELSNADKSEEESLFRFYYKNEEMLSYHEENGYNTDLNGEGCFSLSSEAETLNEEFIVADTLDIETGFSQSVKFVFGKSYSYLLSVPDIIEEDPFSKKIFDGLYQIIQKEAGVSS